VEWQRHLANIAERGEDVVRCTGCYYRQEDHSVAAGSDGAEQAGSRAAEATTVSNVKVCPILAMSFPATRQIFTAR